MSEEIYSFGKCSYCGNETYLKNGYCLNCHNGECLGETLPDFLKDLFGENK